MIIQVISMCFFILSHSTLGSIDQSNEEIRANCHAFEPPASYPLAWRNESVVESRHGIEIVDPYRWLENPYSEETKQFIKAENEMTNSYLKNCGEWQKINEKLTAVWNYKKYSVPRHIGKYYISKMNTGLQNQDVLYKQTSLEDEPSVLLDPNEMSSDGTIALNILSYSVDGKLLAYSFGESGSDWEKVKIRNVESGEDYPETLKGVKFSVLSWTHDNKGFFYSRYLKYGDGTEIDINENQKIYYHRVGESQSKDTLVVEFPEKPTWRMIMQVSSDGKYAILSRMVNGYLRHYQIYVTDLEKEGEIVGKFPLTPIFTGQENELTIKYERGVLGATKFIYFLQTSNEKFQRENYITNLGSKAVFLTNRNASNHRLVAIDFENPAEENWTTLIEEHLTDVLHSIVGITDDKIWTIYSHDAKSTLQAHSLHTGKVIQKLNFGLESIEDVSFGTTPSVMYLKVKSFFIPGIIYRYDFSEQKAVRTIYREEKINVNGFDRTNYDVKQVFYRSYDGTRVPMTIVQKKTSTKRGPKPCLMTAYGGFGNLFLSSNFNAAWTFFIEAFDGILAAPNIRGGGEYGSKWHAAGSMLNKQNSFDDFYAASEYLIENEYTTPDKFAIRGISNSGLLVGVAINQRPDLYKAAIPLLGVMDMLRYHKFTCGFSFTSEQGNPEEKIHFENLLKYSPLHNIRSPNSTKNQYPSTLIMTGDHDDRVSPLHSLKFAAALQHTFQGNQYQTNPILMYELSKAGHPDVKPTYKFLDQETDLLTFLYRALSIKIDL